MRILTGTHKADMPLSEFAEFPVVSGDVVLTYGELDRTGNRLCEFEIGGWFATITANRELNGLEIATGWVEYISTGAVCIHLNRGWDNAYWVDRDVKVLPIPNPWSQEEKEMYAGIISLNSTNEKERVNNMAIGDGKAVTVEAAVEDDVNVDAVNLDLSPDLAIVDLGEVTQPAEEMEEVVTPAVVAAVTGKVTGPVANQLAAFQKRYQFWMDKMNGSGDEAMVESAMNALQRIGKEAKAHGITEAQLIGGATGGGGTTANAGSTAGATQGEGKKKSTKVPRSVKEKDAAAAHKAGKLAEQAAAKPAGEARSAAPAKAKERVLRPCLDGCGAMVGGNFQMGHDAKLKSLLLKIERGVEPLSSVPEIVAGIVKFKKGEVETLRDSKGTTTGTVQTYVLTAAPVKFPGRPEIKVTAREE